MNDTETIGVGVIGLGFMGHTHIKAYKAAQEAGHGCRLVAVCDQDPDRRAGTVQASWDMAAQTATGSFDPATVHAYADLDALLADVAVSLVSICTPTDTHVDLAMRALSAGKHVLIEKPVALRSRDVRRLGKAAATASTLCMPALCMRFWPEWVWLRRRIEDRTYGAVRSAVFQRVGGVPTWSPSFYQDPRRSGGALGDLHVHDADFVRWCFGDPYEVVTSGSISHLTTVYRYRQGPAHVVAEGGWSYAPEFPFRMRYSVAFERATAEFDLDRDPPLMLAAEGRLQDVRLDSLGAYDLEIRHLLDAIRGKHRVLDATVEDAEAVARLLEAERDSMETGVPVRFKA